VADRALLRAGCAWLQPRERLVVCRNPLLAQARARKREDLLAATEAQLAKIGAATARA